jgi:hypothetical protein
MRLRRCCAGAKAGQEGWLDWLRSNRLGLRRAVGQDMRGRRYWALGRQAGCFRVFVEEEEGSQGWGWYEGGSPLAGAWNAWRAARVGAGKGKGGRNAWRAARVGAGTGKGRRPASTQVGWLCFGWWLLVSMPRCVASIGLLGKPPFAHHVRLHPTYTYEAGKRSHPHWALLSRCSPHLPRHQTLHACQRYAVYCFFNLFSAWCLTPLSGEALQRLVKWLQRGGLHSEVGLLRALQSIPAPVELARPGDYCLLLGYFGVAFLGALSLRADFRLPPLFLFSAPLPLPFLGACKLAMCC